MTRSENGENGTATNSKALKRSRVNDDGIEARGPQDFGVAAFDLSDVRGVKVGEKGVVHALSYPGATKTRRRPDRWGVLFGQGTLSRVAPSSGRNREWSSRDVYSHTTTTVSSSLAATSSRSGSVGDAQLTALTKASEANWTSVERTLRRARTAQRPSP